MSGPVLVFNAGSSSVKYLLVDPITDATLASGLLERVGHADASLRHRVAGDGSAPATSVEATDHGEAIRAILRAFAERGPDLGAAAVAAVGHRVVMGGDDLFAPTVITDAVLARIDALAPLAPLHNPANAATIRIARALLPDVPHVAVFDTAFFHDLPPQVAHYAIDPAFAAAHRIRRYGFHGISHEYVARTVRERMSASATAPSAPPDAAELRQIVLHLGNGASASAVVGTRPVETSMGLTPLEGLVMGTRSGDLDPAVAFYLHRELGMTIDEIDHLLNYESGLLGMAGTNDLRDVHRRIDAGDRDASLALDVYVHRLRKYVGAYAAAMAGVDALTFTAGVGENDARVRAAVVEPLAFLGIVLDPERNERDDDKARVISADGSPVTVLVVPTREEQSIAHQVIGLVG